MPQVSDKIASNTESAPINGPTLTNNAANVKKPSAAMRALYFVLAVIGCTIAGAVLFIIFAVGNVIAPAGCTKATEQAEKAAPELTAQLNKLKLIPNNPAVASSSTSGDCIDTASHTADASIMYLLDAPLFQTHQTVNVRLLALGYHPTQPLALDPIDTPSSHSFTASANYTDPSHQTLLLSYIIPHDRNACPQIDSENSPCWTKYMKGFEDLNKLKITSVSAYMSLDFPHN